MFPLYFCQISMLEGENMRLSVGQTDSYSKEKLEKLRRKYPELTYSTLCMLREYGLKEKEIQTMYRLPRNAYFFFKENHYQILKGVYGW